MISDFRKDPIENAINNGIRRGIKIALENECLRSAIVLIYSGMDVMAYLAMPKGQLEVTRSDFIKWAHQYIKFPCKEQLTGEDLYGARCSMVHTYGVYSKMSREGKCRMIGYVDQVIPEIIYNPTISKVNVLVSIHALAAAFLQGIDSFLIDVYSDSKRAQIIEGHMRNLVLSLPYNIGIDNNNPCDR